MTLSRSSDCSASRESISNAIFCNGDMAPSSALLVSVSVIPLGNAGVVSREGSVLTSLYGLCASSSVVGGVGGVFAGTCCALATCKGTLLGLTSYC